MTETNLTPEDRSYLAHLYKEFGVMARGTKVQAWMEILYRAWDDPSIDLRRFQRFVGHAVDHYPGLGLAIGEDANENPDGWQARLARQEFEGIEGYDDTCGTCIGSGIGQSGDPDTSRCTSCGGSGVRR